MRLETEDLVLKNGIFQDWKSMYENLWRHEESARYMLWQVTGSEEEAQIRMQKSIEHQKKNPLAYFVYEKKSSQAIGFAGMMKIAEGVYEDTGIAIGPSFIGRGYGKQILNALVKQAFEELNADRLVCSCRSKNEASRGMQLACGFTYSHSEEREDVRNGERYVLDFYQLDRQKR